MITPSTLDKQHGGQEAPSDETNRATESAEGDLEALEARIDELEAGMKAVASSVEDTSDHVAILADRLDGLDAPADTDAELEPTTYDTNEKMFQ